MARPRYIADGIDRHPADVIQATRRQKAGVTSFGNPMLSFLLKLKSWQWLILVLGVALASGPAAGAPGADARQVSAIKGAVWLWTRLDGLRKDCPELQNEDWRLGRLEDAISPEVLFSPIDYLKGLKSQVSWDEMLNFEVSMITKAVGGCGTDAMREWVAGARRLLDTTSQNARVNVNTTWPASALQEPIKIDIEGLMAVNDQSPGTLQVLLHNPEQGPVGIALSGKELRAGLCTTFTSADVPITNATDIPGRLLILQPGETKSIALTLDEECFAETVGSLSGAVVIVRNGVVEYRALSQLNVARIESSAPNR